MFFVYILVVHEEYIIKSSNFNIRKFSRVRVRLWFLVVIFCTTPPQITLRIIGVAWPATHRGSPRVYMPYTNSPNSTWRALALGHVQWCLSKSGQSDTRDVTVDHEYNSLQHSKGMGSRHFTPRHFPPRHSPPHPIAEYYSIHSLF